MCLTKASKKHHPPLDDVDILFPPPFLFLTHFLSLSLALSVLSIPICPIPIENSALHDAAEAGDVETLRSLLAKAAAGTADADFDPMMGDGNGNAGGLDLDERDDEGCTPLHLALLRGV